jgi:uncharacterized protein YebE (UPF0316 family)
MRNWLRQQLINILVDTDSRPARISRNSVSVSFDDCDIAEKEHGIDLPDPIRFRVQQVSGGTVIETKWYDYKKDEERVKLHIVTPEENLAESIGKIVTMELLQK